MTDSPTATELACARIKTPTTTVYATKIPTRKPALKLHATPGLAHAALSHGGRRAIPGELWRLDAAGWVLVHRVEPGDLSDDLPWRKK